MPEHPTSGCRRTEAIHHFQVNQMSITVVNLQRFLLLLLRKVFYWYPGPNSALSHSPKTPIIIRDNKGEKGQNPKKKSTELHRGKQLWFCPSSLAADAQPAWSVDLMSPHPRPADGLSYTLCNKSNLGLFLYSFELKKKKKFWISSVALWDGAFPTDCILHPPCTARCEKLREGKHRRSYRK